jgi:hypothetical protein
MSFSKDGSGPIFLKPGLSPDYHAHRVGQGFSPARRIGPFPKIQAEACQSFCYDEASHSKLWAILSEIPPKPLAKADPLCSKLQSLLAKANEKHCRLVRFYIDENLI